MDLDHIFSYHPPTGPEQLRQYETIRAAGKVFAQAILDNSPAGADQTCAIRHVRDAVMTTNADIALDGRL
jgi:hypothetical protein